MNYKKYSDGELIDSYSTMIDYSGKANDEILAEIENRGGLENFLKQIELKKTNQKEIGRIKKEVYEASKDYSDLEFIKQFITSDILSKEDLDYLVERTFMEHQAILKDKTVTSNTIIGSIVGTLIGSIAGSLFLIFFVVAFGRIIYFSLIGVYIICYQIIKLITKQSRNNGVVFIATLISTILSLLLVICLEKLLIGV